MGKGGEMNLLIILLIGFFFLFTFMVTGVDFIESLILSSEHRIIRSIVWSIYIISFVTTVIFVLNNLGGIR